MTTGGVRKLIAALLLVAISAISLLSHTPPNAANANADGFSAARAATILERLLEGVGPHPIGTAAHDTFRDRITTELRRLNLTPIYAPAAACSPENVCANLTNILAWIPGATTEPAVVLTAHYDTVAAASGAADDGAGVATLIATAEILVREQPRRRRVLLLFTDGEEDGLLGARAFAESEVAKQVGTFVNFEARGTSGPSILFETSRGSLAHIRRARQILPAPIVATSLTAAVYEHLPNSTDLSVYKQLGFEGYNFAFIEREGLYHTELDDLAHLDRRSLQHHGNSALALARGLADLGPLESGGADAVYFDLLGRTIISWPKRLALPLAAASLLLLVAAALRLKKEAPGRRCLLLLLRLSAGLICSLALGVGFLWLSSTVLHDPHSAPAFLFNGSSSLAALACLSLALRRYDGNVRECFLVGWTLVSALGVATALLSPGAHYLFSAPALIAAASSLALAVRPSLGPWASTAVMLAPAAAWAAILPSTLYLVHAALGADAAPVFALVAATAGITIAPLFLKGGSDKRGLRLPLALGSLTVGALLCGGLLPRHSADTPRRANVVWAYEHTSELILDAADAPRDAVPEFPEQGRPFPWYGPTRYRHVDGKKREAGSWSTTQRSVTPAGEVLVKGRVLPNGDPKSVTLLLRTSSTILGLQVNGRPLQVGKPGEWTILTFHDPKAAGEEVSFTQSSEAPLEGTLLQSWSDLPQTWRASWAIPYQDGNQSVVSTPITIQ